MKEGLTIKELETVCSLAKQHKLDLVVELTIPGQTGTEFIINKCDSIDNKLLYYKKTYDNTLTHKFCKEIRMVRIIAADCAFIYDREGGADA